MKFFVCFAALLAVASTTPVVPASSGQSVGSTAGSSVGSGVNANVQEIEPETPPSAAAVQAAVLDLTRLRKSAGGYGGASIPAPPCPKNYLFSCQPNLSPIACAAPAAGYGSAGAYSAPVPSYVTPVSNGASYSSLPQQYVNAYAPQGAYGYGHPGQFSQFY